MLLDTTGIKKHIVKWSMDVGKNIAHTRNIDQKLGMRQSLKYKIAGSLFFENLKGKVGLSRSRMCISGAAPISEEILRFFSALDLPIYEVYGQSEGSGPTSFNRPGQTKYGSVGPAFPDVDIKIANDGEILVRGRNVFLGYYKDQEATNATLHNGWLHSGDLGKIDSDGFLNITGRKKDIIITAGGKNITPKNIESALKTLPMISQAVVIGDRRRFLSAILTIDQDKAQAFAKEHGVDVNEVSTHPIMLENIQREIDKVNCKLAQVEEIRKFKILPRDLDIENDELTPTLKVKRNVVYKNWEKLIDSIYV